MTFKFQNSKNMHLTRIPFFLLGLIFLIQKIFDLSYVTKTNNFFNCSQKEINDKIVLYRQIYITCDKFQIQLMFCPSFV